MARQGRELEKLVAILERLLSDKNIDIKSPDYIRGVNSGSLREIDVALRVNVGSTHVLVILEVRDRQGTEDIDWIEQLATKRDDVVAAKVIAVSSSGFSEGARNTAARRGIELRTIDSLTADAIINWFGTPYLRSTRDYVDLLHVELYVESHYLEVVKAPIANVDADTPFLVHVKTGETISFNQAWQEMLKQNPQVLINIEPDVEARHVNFRGNYADPNSRYQVLTEQGPVGIIEIVFEGEVYSKTSKIPATEVIQYSKIGGEQLTQSVRFKDEEVDITFYKTSEAIYHWHPLTVDRFLRTNKPVSISVRPDKQSAA